VVFLLKACRPLWRTNVLGGRVTGFLHSEGQLFQRSVNGAEFKHPDNADQTEAVKSFSPRPKAAAQADSQKKNRITSVQ
jgi:hypothetical protein